MRDLIKILIALAFMVVAFFVGKYLVDEKCAIQLKEANEKTSIDKNRIQQLQDSINFLKQISDTNNANIQIPLSKKSTFIKPKRQSKK